MRVTTEDGTEGECLDPRCGGARARGECDGAICKDWREVPSALEERVARIEKALKGKPEDSLQEMLDAGNELSLLVQGFCVEAAMKWDNTRHAFLKAHKEES